MTSSASTEPGSGPRELIIVRQRYTPFGGAERFISRMLEQLAARGVRIRVLCRQWDGEGDFDVIRLPVIALSRSRRDRTFARLACRQVRASPGALVQSHERIECCDLYRAGDGVHREWLHQRGRRRRAWQRWLEYLSPFHHQTLQAERRLFASPRLKYVICNSQMVSDEIVAHFGFPRDRIRVIHNGVDTERFHPGLRDRHRERMRTGLGLAGDTPLYLFVGSGYERKGLDNALEALARADPRIHLVVVGKDRKSSHYRGRAARLGIADRVVFLGPQQDVEPWYGTADALLLPTLYDPFPNVAIEAMACGLPVITSTKSGTTDIIEQDVNGFICDALDTDTLAGLMGRLLDPAVRRRVGAAARQRVAGLTLDNMTRQYLALYAEILGQPPQRGP